MCRWTIALSSLSTPKIGPSTRPEDLEMLVAEVMRRGEALLAEGFASA